MSMLSFELSAVDLILAIAVFVLLVLYTTKLANCPEEVLRKSIRSYSRKEKDVEVRPRENYGECPRGFGNIRKLGSDGSVSERCLGCYRIMECYSEGSKDEF